MKVTVSRFGSHEMVMTLDDIPNEDKLVSLDINFQDMAVNLYYEGWKPIAYPLVESDDAAVVRYDGELDPPGMRLPRPDEMVDNGMGQQIRPRPVKDNPQA